ncbi:MAG: response regulator [Candidatus Aminicenantes bacterium]|nr:MAG: response regulator [Candidatus Aminicenantes bacterium]
MKESANHLKNSVDTGEKNRLYINQVRQLYERGPVGIIATLVNAGLLSFIQWPVISPAVILTWVSLLFVITLVRGIYIYKYLRTPSESLQSRRWGTWFVIGLGISGIVWGAVGIFLFPGQDLARQIFPAFVLGGMVAGATSAFSALKMAYFAYSIPALLPIIIRFFSIGDNIHFIMGVMSTLFALLMTVTAIRSHNMLKTSLELGFENKSLVNYLSEAKDKAERMNKKLEAEILERKKVEQELKKHQEQLETMVEERTLELKEANKELKMEISERKQAEEALRESEEKYRLLVDHANDGIFIVQDEVIKFANPPIFRISGYSPQELTAIPFLNLIHPEDRSKLRDRYKKIKKEEIPGSYSVRVISKSGQEFFVSINHVLIRWEGRPAALNFLRDITQQKKLEAQLQLAQKMQSIGTLAGGIAHDFNNLLMGIQGNISLMLDNFTPGHPDHKKLKQIDQYVQSGANLTKQLLGFARSGKYEVNPTNLNEIIEKTSSMFGRTRKEIKIFTKFQENIWTVEVDAGQIEQVFLNIYINAWQAMPRGGELHIETGNTMLKKRDAKSHDVKPGKYVKISITDTGIGIDDEIRQRIFDPFFTTKEIGRGTGLGLASAYGIIRNHDGIIDIESEKGKGTTFYIYLPASEKKVPLALTKQASTKLLSGAGTILLVDDEDIILDVGKQMLQRMGFEVKTANNGKEAIRVFKENRDNIDLIILDIIMPEMDGTVIYDSLKGIDPGIKVLISSGYSFDDNASEMMKKGCRGFIQKPFSMNTLSTKLNEILSN